MAEQITKGLEEPIKSSALWWLNLEGYVGINNVLRSFSKTRNQDTKYQAPVGSSGIDDDRLRCDVGSRRCSGDQSCEQHAKNDLILS